MHRSLVVLHRWLALMTALVVRAGHAQTSNSRSGVDSALRHFTVLVARMANDSIAAMYAPDGMLAGADRTPIVGPAAIQAFLDTFAGYHVLAYATVADTLRIRGDTAFQVGRWWQRVQVPAGDTVFVSGGFTAEWVRNTLGQWHLRRMGTMPREAGPWPGPASR
jgi:ketosteroid isomerase-like protein